MKVELILLTISTIIVLLVFVGGIYNTKDYEYHKEYFANICASKWSSFETRIVELSEYAWVCQVFYEEQWLPSENIVFDLNK